MSPNTLKVLQTVAATAGTSLAAGFPAYAPAIVAVASFVSFVLGLFHPKPAPRA